MLIRPANVEDAEIISEFVAAIARDQIGPSLSTAGLQHLLADMSTVKQRERIQSGFRYFLGFAGDTLIGVTAIRLPSHLYYLFVHPQWQRLGIGRELFHWARSHTPETADATVFTVNSSLNAIGAYESMGFVVSGAVEEMHGVRYQPMRMS